jgi:hypothetical protein
MGKQHKKNATKSEIKQIGEMYMAGKSISEICALTGRSQPTVSKFCFKFKGNPNRIKPIIHKEKRVRISGNVIERIDEHQRLLSNQIEINKAVRFDIIEMQKTIIGLRDIINQTK